MAILQWGQPSSGNTTQVTHDDNATRILSSVLNNGVNMITKDQEMYRDINTSNEETQRLNDTNAVLNAVSSGQVTPEQLATMNVGKADMNTVFKLIEDKAAAERADMYQTTMMNNANADRIRDDEFRVKDRILTNEERIARNDRDTVVSRLLGIDKKKEDIVNTAGKITDEVLSAKDTKKAFINKEATINKEGTAEEKAALGLAKKEINAKIADVTATLKEGIVDYNAELKAGNTAEADAIYKKISPTLKPKPKAEMTSEELKTAYTETPRGKQERMVSSITHPLGIPLTPISLVKDVWSSMFPPTKANIDARRFEIKIADFKKRKKEADRSKVKAIEKEEAAWRKKYEGTTKAEALDEAYVKYERNNRLIR